VRATTQGARFGFASGQFYATAALAYGRVYLGNTDGFVYSFALDSGTLAWRHKTVRVRVRLGRRRPAPKGKPSVYVGSYDGTFYALDARSGKRALELRRRWRDLRRVDPARRASLYFSNIRKRSTLGLRRPQGPRAGPQFPTAPTTPWSPTPARST
jgi:hypothetical protein